MIIFNSVQQLKNHRNSIRDQKKIIGFVPTMGALHEGHISLIKRARADCDLVIASIFVNPTQFNDPSDLEKYPRTPEADHELLKMAGCDIVFAPEVTEMYTERELELKRLKIDDKSWAGNKNVDFGQLDKVMEGRQRPGHFNGVAQVVSKLFRMVNPDKAYFGQKDFQQLAIIRSMVKQLEMPVEVVGCPIIREPNGLAMSSRNTRLTKDQRERASVISRTLFHVKELYKSKSIAELTHIAEEQIGSEPDIVLEYFEIADADTLQPLNNFEQSKSVIVCIAIKMGDIRLIDNIILF